MKNELSSIVERSRNYSEQTLSLQAAASVLPPDFAKLGSTLSEITAEGYPDRRFHSGTKFVDQIENTCILAAKTAFRANYANVQPLSCSMANIAVITSLLSPGDKILSLALKEGGHLTHGADVSLTGKLYDVSHYHLINERLDMDLVEEMAVLVQPRLIIAGTSSYTRAIDYSRFRAIADRVGATLLADISHTSGLVSANLLPSPIDHAHITTTSTYKQLYGPRGGLILSGSASKIPHLGKSSVKKSALDRAIFPAFQGTPDFAQIAMKAAALEATQTAEFSNRMKRVMALAKIFELEFLKNSLDLVSGGTDTHMLVVNLKDFNHSGKQVEQSLERIGIITNRNLVPGDQRNANETSGLRIGTNVAAYRNLSDDAAKTVASIIVEIIKSPKIGANQFAIYHQKVADICKAFPLRETQPL